ncbi:MAG: carboxypeptidase regulatory-like domain-containing protein [Sedimentisphaerales bacterium]|nr:carboxypeptidase regulatory-like domain-containing protein [Sedimentisphaerales bacterium]
MNEIVSTSADAAVRYLLVGSVAAAILVPLAWLIIQTTRLRAPVYRHTIWLYCLIGTVALPAIWLHGPKLRLPVLPAQPQVTETPYAPQVPPQRLQASEAPWEIKDQKSNIRNHASDAPSGQESELGPVRSEPLHGPAARAITIFWKPILAGVWLAGFAFMLVRLVVGWVQLRSIRRCATPIEPGKLAEDLAGHCLEVRLTDQAPGPVCLGVLRPVVLLPRRMYQDASANDLRMILTHERAHIDRRDGWVNLFQRLLEGVFFFHWLVWVASRQLTHERERICDNWVLAKGVSIDDYMLLLSGIGERILMKTRHMPTVALFEGGLLSRVRSLLDPQHSRITHMTRRSAWTCALSFVLCFAALGTIRLGARPNPDIPTALSAATILTGATDSNDASFRPQEETLGPSERRPNGDSSLAGRVIDADSGEPIPHASVYLFSADTHDAIFIRVASDGSFLFKDIAGGQYVLRTTHTAGYQDVSYNPEGKMGNLLTFTLGEAEHRTNIVLKAAPAYTISGKVLDEAGNPPSLGTLWVTAWQAGVAEGLAGRFTNVAQTSVGPDGSYALDGLDARPTYVAALDYRSENKDEYYPPCYHPGTLDRNKATVISFDKSPAAKNVDIRLQRHGEYSLEGTITDESTGSPIEKALVVVHHTDLLFDQITTYTDAQGHYRLDTVSPGELLVHVDAKPFGFVRTRQLLTIGNETKETRLDLSLKPGITIHGKFVDTAGKPVEFTWSIHGGAYHSSNPDAQGPSWSGSANRYSVAEKKKVFFVGGSGDYHGEEMNFPTPSTFLIEGLLPGLTFVNFNPKTSDLVVQSILYKGKNITLAGFETSLSDREVQEVTIVLAWPVAPVPR